MSLLLSPPAVLFQVAVTVSPILYAPPVPDAPLMLMRASLTVGATLSTVALVLSAAVVLPVAVAVTDTFLFAPSIAPEVRVWVAVQMPPLLLAATAAPPPNCEKSMVTPVTPALLSPPAVLFQVAVTVSPILYAPPVPDAPLIEMLPSVTVGPGAVILLNTMSSNDNIMSVAPLVMVKLVIPRKFAAFALAETLKVAFATAPTAV